MSLDLVDAGRLKVSLLTDCVVEAEHRATGKDRSAIMREVLHAWAEKKSHEASLLSGLLKTNGLTGNHGE